MSECSTGETRVPPRGRTRLAFDATLANLNAGSEIVSADACEVLADAIDESDRLRKKLEDEVHALRAEVEALKSERGASSVAKLVRGCEWWASDRDNLELNPTAPDAAARLREKLAAADENLAAMRERCEKAERERDDLRDSAEAFDTEVREVLGLEDDAVDTLTPIRDMARDLDEARKELRDIHDAEKRLDASAALSPDDGGGVTILGASKPVESITKGDQDNAPDEFRVEKFQASGQGARRVRVAREEIADLYMDVVNCDRPSKGMGELAAWLRAHGVEVEEEDADGE